jgi:hypothetical protein
MTALYQAYLPLRAWAARYGLSPAAVYRLHHKGQLTIVKMGRRSLVAVDDGNRLMSEAARLPRLATSVVKR